jgi:hypothetical protein
MKKVLAVAATTLALIAGGLFSAGAASAKVPGQLSINFAGDAPGVKPNGFSSIAAPKVTFYDTIGADLQVANLPPQTHGRGLIVSGDDASALEIRFATPTSAISLAFGNDDGNVVTKSDLARLTLFRGSTMVGRVDVHPNANDVMDQTISKTTGVLFNRATFVYVSGAGKPLNVTETVDDITINPLCTITGNAGNNTLVGTSGNDVICGDTGADTIKGHGGDDVIFGGGGADHITGGKGADVIYGGGSADSLSGGRGRDKLLGGKGDDQLSGDSGKDELKGGKGRDRCDGGTGHDTRTSCEVHVNIP